MSAVSYLKESVLIFVIAFAATAVVTIIFNYFTSAGAVVEWATSFRFGIIFAIVFPVMHYLEARRKTNKSI
ncbi:MAG: hypothetical protein ACM3Q2_14915 [Syntrophothermus sp.]